MATQNSINTVEIDKAIVNAKGDLIVGSADDTPAILTVGNEGDILKVGAASALAWGPAAGVTDEKVGYNGDDPAPGYLEGKIIAGTGISVAEGTGGDENKLKINCTVTDTDTDTKVAFDAGDTAAAGYFSDKIIAGTGIAMAEGSGASENKMVVRAVGGGISWEVITGATNAVINCGYIANHAGTRVEVTLPGTCPVGSVIKLTGIGAAGWKLVIPASDFVFFGNVACAGAGGYLESLHWRDSVELVCVVADSTWNVISAVGNVTVVTGA